MKVRGFVIRLEVLLIFVRVEIVRGFRSNGVRILGRFCFEKIWWGMIRWLFWDFGRVVL